MPTLHLRVVPAGNVQGFIPVRLTEGGFTDPWGYQPPGSKYIGTTNNNQPRINNTGSTDSVNQLRNPNPTPTLPHVCQVCQRSFSTKSGLGVHIRKAHPDFHDNIHKRVDVKARWCEEEILLLAQKEAELKVHNNPRFMNQELCKVFPKRTLEAIKKARQKPEYKETVRRYIDQLEASPLVPPENVESNYAEVSDSVVPNEITPTIHPQNDFIEFLLALPTPPRRANNNIEALTTIIGQANNIGKESTLISLTSYLIGILQICLLDPREINSNVSPSLQHSNISKRQKRREEYALTQQNWRKHQNRCIKSILEGPNESVMPPRNIMEPYWKSVMEQENTKAPRNENLAQELGDLWNPVNIDEIQTCRPPLSTSPGPDGVTGRQLKAISNDVLVRVLNLILWCGKIPAILTESRTIFIPKKSLSTEPGEYRPITIPSVIVRLLHSILAKRLSTMVSLDPRQRGFTATDGCSDNTTLIDLLLRNSHQTYKSCYLASLDVSKAFDSVSHNAIFGTLTSYGLPTEFIEYLKGFYGASKSRLVGRGWTSEPFTPRRGVKQGDPLSPVLFNIIIDRLIRSLPSEIGCYIGSAKSNAVAFADDLVLYGSTPEGLQRLIDCTETYLSSCGLILNSSKSLTISIQGQPKNKRTVVEQRTFKIAGRVAPALKRTEEWVYLGIPFSAEGKSKFKPQIELEGKLSRLTKAPLKPQQRLYALRTVLIPQLYHRLTLGSVLIGCLKKTDRLIRNTVRKWLGLPHDTPIAFFHAQVDQGGLGLPSLRWHAPLLRKERLTNLHLPNLETEAIANIFIAKEIDHASKRLRYDGKVLNTRKNIDENWSTLLYKSVDGFGLREASHHKQAHRWIREPSKLLTGRDFINCIKIRINALPSKSRTTRGRSTMDRMCRGGCGVPETTNHIIQQCHRTHAIRVDRHNSVASYIKHQLNNRGYITAEEPRMQTADGLRKPDLVACLGRKVVVVDAQVVTDSYSLDEAHRRKANYYNTPEICEHLSTRFRAETIDFLSVTLNWRGVWSKQSIDQLLKHDILRKKDSALVSTRVMIGGVRAFRNFNTTTMVYRRGIG